MRRIEIPGREEVSLVFSYGEGLSLDQYLDFCGANPGLRCERTAEGEVVIVPPAGGEGAFRSGEAFGQVRAWALSDGRGRAFDSSVEFLLPDGSALSPDASWVLNESLHRLSLRERREFLRLTPEFIIKVMSPSDRLKAAKAKMECWIANGVELAWLIDGDRQTVYVYRQGRAPAIRRGIKELAGEGSLKGFTLSLSAIWRGLR